MTGRGPMPLWAAWVLWAFVMVLVLAVGYSPVDDSDLDEQAIAHGDQGRFTATHSEPDGTKGSGRHWVGTFVSDDGGTETDVVLRQNDEVTKDSVGPVDQVVHVIDDPTTGDPIAFTDDYDNNSRAVLGIVLMIGGSIVATGLLVVYLVRRRRRRLVSQ